MPGGTITQHSATLPGARAGSPVVRGCQPTSIRSGSHLSAPVAFPLGGGGNSHPSIPDHSPVSTEFQHGVLNDAADQSGTVVMIGVGGGVSLPFLFFHAAPNDARRSCSQPHNF